MRPATSLIGASSGRPPSVVGHGLVGDARRAGLASAPSRLLAVRREMEIREKRPGSGCSMRDLPRLRLLHLHDHVGFIEDAGCVGSDVARRLCGSARRRSRCSAPASRSTSTAWPAPRQFANARGRQADPILVGLDLLRVRRSSWHLTLPAVWCAWRAAILLKALQANVATSNARMEAAIGRVTKARYQSSAIELEHPDQLVVRNRRQDDAHHRSRRRITRALHQEADGAANQHEIDIERSVARRIGADHREQDQDRYEDACRHAQCAREAVGRKRRRRRP